jgi:Protein of unknown function (DUF3109)
MVVVQDKLVSDDIFEENFICNLDKCKGACCWEGDFGAPLTLDELKILDKIYPKVRPFLTEEGQKAIDKDGCYEQAEDDYGTTLINGGPCAFMTKDVLGTAHCGIEQAWKAGVVDFRKPISCHLYPIRVSTNEIAGFEALNYDKWDICSAACQLGNEHKVPVYQFLKDALVRKYGEGFYEEMEASAAYLKSKSEAK